MDESDFGITDTQLTDCYVFDPKIPKLYSYLFQNAPLIKVLSAITYRSKNLIPNITNSTKTPPCDVNPDSLYFDGPHLSSHNKAGGPRTNRLSSSISKLRSALSPCERVFGHRVCILRTLCYLSLALLFQSSDQSLIYCSLDCSRLSPGFWRAHKDALYCSTLRTLSRIPADTCGVLGPLNFLSLTLDGSCLQSHSVIAAPIGEGRWDTTHDIVGRAATVC